MSDLHVTVNEGELQGKTAVSANGKRYYSFQGIPYAEPPVGDRRFQPPVPVKPWKGVKMAVKEGNECAQVQMLAKNFAGYEDCLFLNVYTPKLPSESNNEDPYPVMIHIHGGGFINGSGNMDIFSPDFLVERSTIIVTVNYRLGVFGFLSLDIPEAPGNSGLRDQNLAIRWVHDNIKFFNGDPNNITLFGISAGSASVEYQMLSPMSEGLFSKAILQSGSCLNPWVRSRHPAELSQRLVKALGQDISDPVEMRNFLINVSAKDLAMAAFSLKNVVDIKRTEIFSFTPVVEKRFDSVEPFLIEEPIKLFKSGNFYSVPTITGFCEKEGILFKHFYGTEVLKLKQKRYLDYVPDFFIKDRELSDEKLREIYKRNFDDKNEEDMVNDFLSDLLFVGGIYTSLMYRMKTEKPHYLYKFTYDGNLNFVKVAFNIREKGACHGDDTTYLTTCFYIEDSKATPRDKAVRDRLVTMWTNFARTGNPTPSQTDLIKKIWNPVSENKLTMMEIGGELVVKTNPWPERMKLWTELYQNTL